MPNEPILVSQVLAASRYAQVFMAQPLPTSASEAPALSLPRQAASRPDRAPDAGSY